MKKIIVLSILTVLIIIIIVYYIFKCNDKLQKTGLGVCYDTGLFECNLSGNEIKECINSDFKQIKKEGYKYIRTYFPKYGYIGCSSTNTMGMYTEIASKYKIKLLLGVGTNEYDTYKDCIIQSILKYPKTISGISIGNEDVQNNNWHIAQKILEKVADLKSHIRNPPLIGTCQQSGFWICIKKGKCICADSLCNTECITVYKKMLEKLDFIGANVYPGSNGGKSLGVTDKNKNKESLYGQIDCLINSVGIDKLWITETGLPSNGKCKDGNGNMIKFTSEIQKAYTEDVIELKKKYPKLPIYIFSAFDVPSKISISGCESNSNTETHMGVLSGQKCKRRKLESC